MSDRGGVRAARRGSRGGLGNGEHHRPAMTAEHHAQVMAHLGWALAIGGIAATAYSVGKSHAPNADCTNRLLQRDAELILCETRAAQRP